MKAQLPTFLVSFLTLCFLLTTDPAAAQDSARQKASTVFSRSNVAVVPIIGYNRSTDVSFGLMLNVFTRLYADDTLTPPSRSGVGLGYTTNKSWFGFASQKLFLRDDQWRLFWALGLGNYNFQFFDESDETGQGVFVDYQTHTQFFSTNATYNVYKRLYTGLKYQYSKSTTEYQDSVLPTEITRLSSWGVPVYWDSRDYVYYPAKGMLANVLFSNSAKWLGSDVNFSSVTAFLNYYFSFKNNDILASRFYSYFGLGDVPFVGEKVIGKKDLRGYTKGEYRSNKVLSLQTEYRKRWKGRWGMVAFGGVATAFGYNGRTSSGLLPAGGAGARFMLIPKRKMNIGIDLAAGKGDWGVYFRFGEAF